MKSTGKILIMLSALFLLMGGCSSLQVDDDLNFDQAPLIGMIYDQDNQPVAGAVIDIEIGTEEGAGDDKAEQGDEKSDEAAGDDSADNAGEKAAREEERPNKGRIQQERSSVNGRFIINNLPPGVHTAWVLADGYEPNAVRFEFFSREQVLYIKLSSFENLIDMAENAAEKEEYSAATAYLDRAAKIRPDDPVYRYLRAVIAYKEGKKQECLQWLQALEGLPFYSEAVVKLRIMAENM